MLLLRTVLASWVLLLEGSLHGWPWHEFDPPILEGQDISMNEINGRNSYQTYVHTLLRVEVSPYCCEL